MKQGFTLAEVILTLAIVTGAMVALLMAFSSSLGISADVQDFDTAVEIADTAMEGIKNMSYEDLHGFAADADDYFSGVTGFTVDVTTTKPENPAVVEVNVSWLGKNGRKNLTLTTLVSDY